MGMGGGLCVWRGNLSLRMNTILGKTLGSYALQCKICFWARDKTIISESYNSGNVGMVSGLIHS